MSCSICTPRASPYAAPCGTHVKTSYTAVGTALILNDVSSKVGAYVKVFDPRVADPSFTTTSYIPGLVGANCAASASKWVGSWNVEVETTVAFGPDPDRNWTWLPDGNVVPGWATWTTVYTGLVVKVVTG